MPEERQPIFDFPATLSLKTIGHLSDDFQDTVVSIISQHVDLLPEQVVSQRPSSGGKYLSVTVNFVVESQPQLEAIYRDLNAHRQVILVL